MTKIKPLGYSLVPKKKILEKLKGYHILNEITDKRGHVLELIYIMR